MLLRMKQVLAIFLCWGLALATSPSGVAQEAAQAAYSSAQIDELVSPIALYPDALVAQILAASTYPDQVVQANTWLQGHSQLNDAQRTEQVNNQSWDPSVKALTQFPSVLANMAQNLSWTSALGDVFYNQQKDVMDSVQRLRKQAKAAGNLKTTPQQTVTTEAQQGQQVIVIQPANPQVVYVPTYNPTVIYGTPYYPPGYSTSALVTASVISFAAGIAIGAAMSGGCCGWGWNSWGCGWHGGTVVYNRNVYVSNSNVYRGGGYYGKGPRPTPYGNNYNRNVSGNTVNINGGNRNTVNTGNINAGNRNQNINSGNRNTNVGNANRPNSGKPTTLPNSGANANRPTTSQSGNRGYGQRPAAGNSALSGYNSGGATRAESNRGKQSYGGGGSSRGTAPAARNNSGGGQAARGGGGGRRQ
jgi:Protein of unknown function (DUF3300)